MEVSTMDFLKMLERQRLIQSYDIVYEKARAAGREASMREHIGKHDAEIQRLIQAVFQPDTGA